MVKIFIIIDLYYYNMYIYSHKLVIFILIRKHTHIWTGLEKKIKKKKASIITILYSENETESIFFKLIYIEYHANIFSL